MKNGLVLEGGAMRGLFTAGVLDALMRHGVGFDGIVGVSMSESGGTGAMIDGTGGKVKWKDGGGAGGPEGPFARRRASGRTR